MDLFEGEVGRHQQLVSRGNAQHRAVVADPCQQRLSSAGQAAHLLNQFLLAKWHFDHYTPALTSLILIRREPQVMDTPLTEVIGRMGIDNYPALVTFQRCMTRLT